MLNNTRNAIVLILRGQLLAADSCVARLQRERSCINDNWQFTKSDPEDSTASLLYDVRPQYATRRPSGAESGGNSSGPAPVMSNEASTPPTAAIKQ